MKTYEEMTRCVLEARDNYLLRRQHRRKLALRCSAAAAVCCAVLLTAYPLLADRSIPQSSSVPDEGVLTAFSTDAPSAAMNTQPDRSTTKPSNYAARWADRKRNQQYFSAEIGSPPFSTPPPCYYSDEKEVNSAEIGDYLFDVFMSGFDEDADELHQYRHCTAKAYRIEGQSEQEVIAVRFENDETYYSYSRVIPAAPSESDGLSG